MSFNNEEKIHITENEQILADEIIKKIEEEIKSAFAALEGGDSDYYKKMYEEIEYWEKKMVQESGLSIDVIREITARISKSVAAGAAKDLAQEKVQYINQNKQRSENQHRSKWEKKDITKDKNKAKTEEKQVDRDIDIDKDEEQDIGQEENSAKTLAKLYELKHKKNAIKVLRNLLFSMISARMDPKQRAGETAKSNAQGALRFGRGSMLTLGQLIKAGLISNAIGVRVKNRGLTSNSGISLWNVQHVVRSQASNFLDLVNNSGHIHGSMVKIPSKGDALSTISSIHKSIGILNSNAASLCEEKAPRPDFTPFTQEVNNQDRGR